MSVVVWFGQCLGQVFGGSAGAEEYIDEEGFKKNRFTLSGPSQIKDAHSKGPTYNFLLMFSFFSLPMTLQIYDLQDTCVSSLKGQKMTFLSFFPYWFFSHNYAC